MLSIRCVDRSRRVGRHEDFHGLVRVADGPIVETALNPIVASVLARPKRLTERIVRLRPPIDAADVAFKEVGKLNVGGAKAAQFFRLRHIILLEVCRPACFWLCRFVCRRQ